MNSEKIWMVSRQSLWHILAVVALLIKSGHGLETADTTTTLNSTVQDDAPKQPKRVSQPGCLVGEVADTLSLIVGTELSELRDSPSFMGRMEWAD